MRKKFHTRWRTSWLIAVALGLISAQAFAREDLDRRYALQSVGYIRAWDNVDGLFANYVDQAFREYFAEQSRFEWRDLSRANTALTNSELPYLTLIQDKVILKQVAMTFRVESVIRTKIYKEGPDYRFILDFLHAPKMDLLASHEFTLKAEQKKTIFQRKGLKGVVRSGVEGLIARLPFKGQISGRDEKWVTINMGQHEGIRAGDILMIKTLEEVRRHPLLGKIAEWRMADVGRLVVEEVDDHMAFARVLVELPGQRMKRYQKVGLVVHAEIPTEENTKGGIVSTEGVEMNDPEEPPRWGWGQAKLLTGGFSRTYSNGTQNVSGGAFLFGAKVDGRAWFTQALFADLGFGFGTSGYSQSSTVGITGGDASGGMTMIQFNLAVGYIYHITGDLFGPKAWVRAGYRTTRINLPTNATALSGPMNIGGLFLGLGGSVPVKWGLGTEFTLDFTAIRGFGESALFTSGNTSSTADAGFYIGVYWRWKPKMIIRAGVDVQIQSASFASGGSLNQKQISFAPAFSYYF